MTDDDLGFTCRQLKNRDVVFAHHGIPATTLRKDNAKWFLEEMEALDLGAQQQEMARLTGNRGRGIERTAKGHPRNW